MSDSGLLQRNFVAHIRGDVFARHLKDWHNAERHQESARFVAAQVTDLLGARLAEKVLTVWRDEAHAQAVRELPELDRQMELARQLFEEVE